MSCLNDGPNLLRTGQQILQAPTCGAEVWVDDGGDAVLLVAKLKAFCVRRRS